MPLADLFLLLAMTALFARMAYGLNGSDLVYLGVEENDD